MPQEKRKSLNYRSFVICDDPRGIVECQAVRKSSTFSPQKKEQSCDNKIEAEKKQPKRSKSLAVLLEEDKKEVEAGVDNEIACNTTRELAPSKPSFHLTNNVFNNPLNDGVNGHPKNAARDLFKGALNDLHKPWFSSKKSLHEMKKVVRESLMRQCVISNPVFEHHLDSPDVPSTSSSQSSMVYSSNFALSDMSSVSSSSSLVKMGKSSSLMFKLMGLEPFPSSPRSRKPQFGGAHLSLKQRSMDDILEVLKIKGLLKNNDGVPKLLPYVGFPSENEPDDGKPPIVVIKPSKLDPKEAIAPKGLGDNGLGIEDMVTKPRSKRRPPIKGDGLSLGEEREKPAKKLPSLKGRVSNQKTYKMQENVRKGGEVVKVTLTPNRRKIEEEKKVVKSSSDELRSSPQDQTKLTHLRNQKQKDTLLISKNQDLKKRTSTSVLDHQMRRTSRSSSQLEKKRQLTGLKNVHKSGKDESKQTGAANGEKNPSNRPVEACLIPITENDTEEQISLSGPQDEASMSANEDANNGHDPEVTQVTPQEKTDPVTSRKFQTPRTILEASLLSNLSFMSSASSLFGLELKPNSVEEEDINVASYPTLDKLLLDCANEVMEFRSLKISQACLPLPQSYFEHSRNALSSDRLLEDVCKGIEDLKGYLGPSADGFFSDTLSLLIDRDLSFKSGTWEIGWRNTCSQCEVELVVGEVDELVLGSLIEEVVVDFM